MEKVERLTNMVALLLTTKRALTLDEIADEIGGYPDKGETRRAAFERDKKTLRAEGVPLEVVAQPDGGVRVPHRSRHLLPARRSTSPTTNASRSTSRSPRSRSTATPVATRCGSSAKAVPKARPSRDCPPTTA